MGRFLFLPVAAVALVLAACSSDESVANADVGECIESLDDLSGVISELPEADCNEDHEGEVFFLFQHEGDDDDFPGVDALRAEASEACEGEEFEDYTGAAFDDTSIFVTYVTPSEDSWGDGDRETICVAFTGDTLDESFEGNGEDFPLGDGPAGGGEQDFSALIEECEGGDLAACDELYRITPLGSPEEEIGATCGGRSDELLNGQCEATLG